ncbi:MAG: YegS/Rv2252/BmrU family lipid kinase [Chryseolinea sp.]
MKFKKVHVIINPAAGQEEPILSYINTAFQDTDADWEVSVTKQAGDGTLLAEKFAGNVDLIAVYGGDGSISEVAKVLAGKETPLAIIPGGTANVLSKELGIPQNSKESIALIAGDQSKIVQMDMAFANDEPFLIRVNFGVMADMVLEASRELKDKVGQLAYGITAVKTLIQSQQTRYRLKIDGEDVTKDGIALTVTNCGSIGIGEYSFLPDISVHDGLLDVLLMYKSDLMSVLRVAGSTLLQTDSEILKHWRCKEVEITFDKPQDFILDDCGRNAASIHIVVKPNTLNVVVPA